MSFQSGALMRENAEAPNTMNQYFYTAWKKFTLPLNTYCLQLYTEIYVSRLKRVCSKRNWWSLTSTQGQKWLLPAPTLSSSFIWRLKIEVVCGRVVGRNKCEQGGSYPMTIWRTSNQPIWERRGKETWILNSPHKALHCYIWGLWFRLHVHLNISVDFWSYPKTQQPWCSSTPNEEPHGCLWSENIPGQAHLDVSWWLSRKLKIEGLCLRSLGDFNAKL